MKIEVHKMEAGSTYILLWVTCIHVAFLNSSQVNRHSSGYTYEAVRKLRVLEQDFWEWRLKEEPLFGTALGLHKYDDKLSVHNEKAFTRRKEAAESFLERVKDINITGLAAKDKDSVFILQSLLSSFIDGYKYRKYSAYNDISPLEEVVGMWRYLLFISPKKNVKNLENLISRYNALPSQIDDRIALMNDSIRSGLTLNNYSLTGVVEKLESVDVDARFSEFLLPFKDIQPKNNKTQRLKEAALAAIKTKMLPSFLKFKEFLVKEYLPSTRPDIGVSSLPNGADYYKACLKWHISTDLSPLEVHQIGLNEVKRIKKEMQKIMEQDGFRGDLHSYVNSLKNKSELFFESKESLLEGYKAIIAKIEPKLPKFFKKLPSQKLNVREMVNIKGPPARYLNPSLNGERPGYFEVNLFKPTTKPKYNMMALTLHEAVPGHHTQVAYAMESELPYFRRAVDSRHYSSVPFNWLFHSAFKEGWALYAESLGEEMELYDEPYSLLGRYAQELFRAARLVVDTGIHSLGWSRDKAVKYIYEHSTFPIGQVENEINRYISLPGQACGYKIGELKIKELRKYATATLGDQFNIKDFHDEILQLGSAPLYILEKNIKSWVKRRSLLTTSSQPSKHGYFVHSAYVVILCVLMTY